MGYSPFPFFCHSSAIRNQLPSGSDKHLSYLNQFYINPQLSQKSLQPGSNESIIVIINSWVMQLDPEDMGSPEDPKEEWEWNAKRDRRMFSPDEKNLAWMATHPTLLCRQILSMGDRFFHCSYNFISQGKRLSRPGIMGKQRTCLSTNY